MTLSEKYSIEEWEGEHLCDDCKEPVRMTNARWEVLGQYHCGCFGYPACSCKAPHKGECPDIGPMHFDECDGLTTFIRARGDTLCDCGEAYQKHRYCAQSDPVSMGEVSPRAYLLYVLCNGQHIRL